MCHENITDEATNITFEMTKIISELDVTKVFYLNRKWIIPNSILLLLVISEKSIRRQKLNVEINNKGHKQSYNTLMVSICLIFLHDMHHGWL